MNILEPEKNRMVRIDTDSNPGFIRKNTSKRIRRKFAHTYRITVRTITNPAWFGRNHETLYRDIFACFGFNLPYHAGLFTHFGNDTMVLDPGVGRKEQYRRILEKEPFMTLMITLQDTGGHAQLLLVGYNGVPIVLDVHGYGYTDKDGKYVEVRRCVVGEITQPDYFLKRKLTFLVLK